MHTNTDDKILRLPDVIDKTGLSRSTIYHMVANDNFPKPLPIGKRASGWLQSDISAWIQEKVSKRDYQSGDHSNYGLSEST